MRFDGATYDPDLDRERLTGQCRRVWDLMRDGRWRTLAEIAAQLHYPEASISARLRDLRKDRFGGHDVQRRRRSKGLWEYRVQVAPPEGRPLPLPFEASV